MCNNEFARDMERMFNLYKASGANKQFEGDDREEDRLLHLLRILYKHKYPRAYVRVITGAIENHDITPLMYVCYNSLQDETPHIISANDRIIVKNKQGAQA